MSLVVVIFFAWALFMAHVQVALAADGVPAIPTVSDGNAITAAATVPATHPNPELFDPLSSGYLLKLVFSLVIVLALMFIVVWFLKRTGRFNGRAGNYPLSVLAQMPVGTRDRILLIAVGERQMLLGVSQGHIEPLGWVDPPLSPDTRSKANPLEGPFAQLMKKHHSTKIESSGTGTPAFEVSQEKSQ